MGIIFLDDEGKFDSAATQRANEGHNRLYAAGSARQGEEGRSKEESLADAAEVLSSPASNARQAETAARGAESAVPPHESKPQSPGWTGMVGAALLGAIAGVVGTVLVQFAGIKLFGWLYDTFGV